tara:strand:+ start:10042 stop:11988 length:1947 start_codon:yes stop_codon:yes gene_type:complete
LAKSELNLDFPYDLSFEEFSKAVGIGGLWSVGIDGTGYLLSTLEDEAPFDYRAYTVQSIPVQKQRLDTSAEPGEQTFEQWWTRAQHSWVGGAGQNIFDAEGSNRFSFKQSKGIDIWTEGQLKLLKDTASVDNSTGDDLNWFIAGGYIFYSKDGSLYRGTTVDGTYTANDLGGPGSGQDITSITTDGQYVYVCWTGTNNIRKADIDSGSWSSEGSLANDLDPSLISFVKGRLMAAKDNKLYEVDLSTTTAPDPHFTHRTTDWEWTSITESGPAIYASGYAGETSEIYATRLTTQDLAYADTSTLGAPISVFKAPEGEIVHTIRGYLGRALVIGTNKGIRLAVITDETGSLEVSSLLVSDDHNLNYAVKSIELDGDFAYFGWTKYDSTSSGIGKINLSDTTFSSHLMYDIQGDVTSIAQFGGRLLFSVNNVGGGGHSRVIKEHATDYIGTGTLETGEIRYGTFEVKTIRYFDAMLKGTGLLDVDIKRDNTEAYENIVADWEADTEVTDRVYGIIEQTLEKDISRFELKLTLKTLGSATNTPILLEWRTRGEPKVKGRYRYFVPIMLYDTMIANSGQTFGYGGYSQEKLNELVEIYRSGKIIQFQDPGSHLPNGTPSVTVRIEDLQFKSWAPPSGYDGPGGIALVVMREQT